MQGGLVNESLCSAPVVGDRLMNKADMVQTLMEVSSTRKEEEEIKQRN